MEALECAVIGTGWCGGIRAETLAKSALCKKLHICEIRPDRLADLLHERGDVVLGHALALEHPVEVERGVRPNGPCALPRHDAEPGQRLDGEDLDLEPVAESRLVGPHRRHLGPGVARDHRPEVTGGAPPTGPP